MSREIDPSTGRPYEFDFTGIDRNFRSDWYNEKDRSRPTQIFTPSSKPMEPVRSPVDLSKKTKPLTAEQVERLQREGFRRDDYLQGAPPHSEASWAMEQRLRDEDARRRRRQIKVVDASPERLANGSGSAKLNGLARDQN